MPTTYGQQLAQQMGTTAATGLLGGAMGLIFGGLNDRRQLNQQQALQDMQIRGEKEMADYNMNNQYQMWLKTNYGAQVEQLNKAGLNPGLLYNSGGGQPVLGSPSSNVTGATAQQNPGEQAMGMQVAMQSQLTQAQTELIKAETQKTQAETQNVPKTGANIEASTENLSASTKTLIQQVQNQKAQEALTKVETQLKQIDLEINSKDNVKQSRTNEIIWNAEKAFQYLNIAQNEAYIKDETIDAVIQDITAKAAGAQLQNILTQANITATAAQINKMSQEIAQGWAKLSIEQKQLNLNKWEAEIKAEFPGLGQALGKQLNDVMEGLLNLGTGNDKSRRRTYDAPKTN